MTNSWVKLQLNVYRATSHFDSCSRGYSANGRSLIQSEMARVINIVMV